MQYEPPYGTTGDTPYQNGDPSIAQQGSIIPAQAVEYPQREIVNLITKSGYTPSDQDLFQLTRSVRRQFVNFCVDTGQANALSVALDPPLDAYRQGLPLRVLVGTDNTGNCTINVNNLGNRPIVRTNGSQLQPGDLRAGMIAQLVDDGTKYQLTNYLGAVASTINNIEIHIPYAEDTSLVASSIVVQYTPTIVPISNGDLIEVRVANVNSGAATIAIDGTAAVPVKRNDGQPLQKNDLIAGEVVLMEWNYTYWQMMRLVRSQVMLKLGANLTLFVDPVNGNDANDGHDAQHAFRTIQAAINFVQASYAIAGRTVVIQLAPGTYPATSTTAPQVLINNLPGSVVVVGDRNNKLSYVLQGPSASDQTAPYDLPTVLVYGSGSQLALVGVTLQPVNLISNVVECSYSGSLDIQDCAWTGPAIQASLIACRGAQLRLSNGLDCYSNCGMFLDSINGAITAGEWYTLINTHGVNFSAAFIQCLYGYAELMYGWLQFAGSATGKRYIGYLNSAINTVGGGANFLPGSQAGVLDASSVYQ